nr:uncharacterized protein LOC106686520 [Halyomorpha halys]
MIRFIRKSNNSSLMIMRPIAVLLIVSSLALFGLVVGEPTDIVRGESDIDSELPLVVEAVEEENRCIEGKCCTKPLRCCFGKQYCCKEAFLSIQVEAHVCLTPYKRKTENKP